MMNGLCVEMTKAQAEWTMHTTAAVSISHAAVYVIGTYTDVASWHEQALHEDFAKLVAVHNSLLSVRSS